MKTFLLAAATILAAPAAMACPDGALQETANLMVSIGQHGEGVDPAEATASIDENTSACPANPHVLKVAALARATLADVIVEKPVRLQLRQAALADFDRAVAAAGANADALPVMINGQQMAVDFDDNTELRAALVAALEEEG
jgi:hypothetical protein